MLILRSLIILFGVYLHPLVAMEHPRELTAVMELLRSIPAIDKLIKDINSEGAVTIELQTVIGHQFDAIWSNGTRTILVNRNEVRTRGVMLCTLIFEFHNAKSSKQLQYIGDMAKAGMISKETYVEAVER